MKINVNSLENLEIRKNFVRREQFCDVSIMVDYILSSDGPNCPFSWDDIENYSVARCPECDGIILDSKCSSCGYEAADEEDLEDCFQEIYEWHEVSELFYRQLRKHGEPVIDYDGGYLWGRTCTGQAAYLDGVIGAICLELGLLAQEVVA